MIAALIQLGAAVVLFAGWMMLHVLLIIHLLRTDIPRDRKLVALIPPVTPVIAWLAGCRRRTILWVVLLMCYVAARFV